MSTKVYMNSAAEREATEVGKKFMHSTDVVGDMSRAYGTDLSSVQIHADSSSDRKTAQRGVDAFSTGKDIFFARAAFNKNDPASRGLLAHELSHSIQQGVGGEMGGMQHSAPMGAEQGGLIDWFRNLFKKKPKVPNKEDTLDFKVKGESLPQVDGRAMNIKQLNHLSASSNMSHELVLSHMTKDENGVYGGGFTDKRNDLHSFLHKRYQGRDENNLLSETLRNASGTIQIKGLNASRMIHTLKTNAGGALDNEGIGKLYDNLLSGGSMANISEALRETDNSITNYQNKGKEVPASLLEKSQTLRNEASQISEEEVQARDQKFLVGFAQLKGLYLNQLRNIKNKYGTYITQMHPEDFLNKVGLSFYDDFSLLQDMIQLMDEDKRCKSNLFDYENNADDKEYKQLADYYFNAYNILTNYIGTDLNMENPEFNPQFVDILEELPYSDAAKAMEGQIGGPGFNEKEYAGYMKRMQKRFKKEKKTNRLFGRFK